MHRPKAQDIENYFYVPAGNAFNSRMFNTSTALPLSIENAVARICTFVGNSDSYLSLSKRAITFVLVVQHEHSMLIVGAPTWTRVFFLSYTFGTTQNKPWRGACRYPVLKAYDWFYGSGKIERCLKISLYEQLNSKSFGWTHNFGSTSLSRSSHHCNHKHQYYGNVLDDAVHSQSSAFLVHIRYQLYSVVGDRLPWCSWAGVECSSWWNFERKWGLHEPRWFDHSCNTGQRNDRRLWYFLGRFLVVLYPAQK